MKSVVVWLICVCLLQPCCSLPLPLDARKASLQEWELAIGADQHRSEVLCSLCLFAAKLLQDAFEANSTLEHVLPLAERMCAYFMEQSQGYDGQYMCPGMIQSYGPVFFYVVGEGALKPQDLCVILHFCNSTSTHTDAGEIGVLRNHERAALLGGNGKMSVSRNVEKTAIFGGVRNLGDFVDNGKKTAELKWHTRMEDMIGRGKERGGGRREDVRGGVGEGGRGGGVRRAKEEDVIVFVQLSDIHLDQQYSEGAPSQCNLYLCCRSWYNGTVPAGRYGNYKCDLPLATLDLLVETLRELEPQPDFILYTGDNSPHDPWNETWASQTQATQFLMDYLSKQLPDTLIYPALGNHETWPESEYIGTLPEYQEWTKKIAIFWQSLVPLPSSAVSSIADGGYYTLLLNHSLRLVSFNSDYGYVTNLFSALNDQNPYVARQRKWMMSTLEQAEAAGEKVLLIGHVPPGYTSNPSYEEFYLELTKRFSHIIVGHLFGHTHHDQFKLIQDEAGVYGTLLICPSVTPYGRSNPSFRLFTMDSSNYQLLEYQQYHLNLTMANEMAQKGVKPKFELAYTTSDLYDLPDLSPSSWTGLVERFTSFPDLVSEYTYNVYGRSNQDDRSCDPQCVHDTVCFVSNIITLQNLKCIAG